MGRYYDSTAKRLLLKMNRIGAGIAAEQKLLMAMPSWEIKGHFKQAEQHWSFRCASQRDGAAPGDYCQQAYSATWGQYGPKKAGQMPGRFALSI